MDVLEEDEALLSCSSGEEPSGGEPLRLDAEPVATWVSLEDESRVRTDPIGVAVSSILATVLSSA